MPKGGSSEPLKYRIACALTDVVETISTAMTSLKFLVFEIVMFILALYGMFELAKAKIPFLAKLVA
jgi:hypothetical protein